MNVEQLESFEMDDVRFIIDIRAGKDRGKSKDGEFILVKPKEFVEFYRRLQLTSGQPLPGARFTNAFVRFYRALQRRRPKNILEIGMFLGGSLVLFDKLYAPKKLVGVDIRREPIEPLERYRKDRGYIRTFYGLLQGSPELPDVLREEFLDGIDLIVDDASRQYKPSCATFQLCFPLLKPGGLYVIEDRSWSHCPSYQTSTHQWFDKPALTNLIVELIINMPDSEQMNRVTVHRDLAVVEKADTATGAINLSDGHNRLRNRKLGTL